MGPLIDRDQFQELLQGRVASVGFDDLLEVYIVQPGGELLKRRVAHHADGIVVGQVPLVREDLTLHVGYFFIGAHAGLQEPIAHDHRMLALLVAPVRQHPCPAAVGPDLRNQLAQVVGKVQLDRAKTSRPRRQSRG